MRDPRTTMTRSRGQRASCKRGYKVGEDGVASLPLPLTAGEIAALVRAEHVSPFPESVQLNQPPAYANFDDDMGGMPWRLWVVAEMKMAPHAGHKIVFDEHSRRYGVASPINVFLGFWGSFQRTIAALTAE